MKEPLNKAVKRPARRLPTVERRHGSSVHDDSAHLWAVSYADFLMVLLCFFIIFFSTDESKKKNVIQQIFFESAGQYAGQGGVSLIGQAARDVASAHAFPKIDLASSLKEFSISKSDLTDGLIVQFRDGLYENGSYEISGDRVPIFEDFLKKILPYRDQISMTFIGHTDDVQVTPSPRKIFRDNFDLSSLRATRALQFAVRSGFPEDQVSAKGNSKNSRVSRTLSVLIRSRGDLL
jgi:flagellar motor protein MotB